MLLFSTKRPAAQPSFLTALTLREHLKSYVQEIKTGAKLKVL